MNFFDHQVFQKVAQNEVFDFELVTISYLGGSTAATY
jgi:hypothetical protein